MSSNQAAWLDAKEIALRVGPAEMPVPQPNEIIVKNKAVAINPLDWHMQDWGVFIQQWPTIFGCDVAGEVHQVGANVTQFKPGDRVVAHTINLVTGKPQDGAFALYTAVPANKTAILPASVAFESAVVLPLAIEAAACALLKATAGEAMPGVPTPALGLAQPSLVPKPIGKTLVVYGGSSSVGVMTIQLAVACGLKVVTTASPKNFDLCKGIGASSVFDYRDADIVDKIAAACKEDGSFVGIVDAISTPETYKHDLEILSKLGGGHLACTHPPPTEDVPDSVKAGMIFAVDEVADPIWANFITPALENGTLKCLPAPEIVGNGLEHIQEALDKSKAGVSATKLIVTL
ncbi:putative quinone oxidoreductase [Stachybotrys elegans]|uniref:Quinone oxidoreductase n=1 Tax=Stachybotrys elegans TaxID=80388 RepID=A0A8K0T2A5_9HYPO|nr:putative quinone oxidoreductase [Stachybotrys elegans]